MVKVHIDISLFTPDAAFGMISGALDLPMVPQVGESVVFEITRPIEAYCDALPFRGKLHVTNRMHGIGEGVSALLMLEDLTAATPEDAHAIIKMLEENYGLFGDVWDT